MLTTRKLQLIMRGLLIQALGAGQFGLKRQFQPVAFPGWHEGDEEWEKWEEVCLTLLVEAEVLQGLVEVPGRGDGADVAVGADGAQARRARPVPHRRQAPALCEARGGSYGWNQPLPQHWGDCPANQSLKHH